MQHRKDIDGLRAVAVIPVLLFHFGVGLFPGGFTGVDVFFVISGYVIAGSIATDLGAGRFTIANFYIKRIRRIFPALVATALATAIAGLFILLPEDMVDFSRSLVSLSLFASNVYFWKTSGYFAASAQTKPLLHTWSLSVEEQFYLVAPLLFAAVWRYGGKRWVAFLLPLLLASLACSVAAVFVAPTAGFFNLPTRAWELLIGSLLSLSGARAPRGAAARQALGAVGLGLILVGFLTLHETDPFPGWNALYPCVGAACLIWAGKGSEPGGTLAGRLLSTAPFVWIGNISYSLYLVHWPLVAYTNYLLLRPPGLAEGCALMVVSLGLAWLSYRFVEQPFRRAKLKRPKRVLIAGGATIAVLASLGLAGHALRGLPGRFPDYAEVRIPGVKDWGGAKCFNMNSTARAPWDAASCTRTRGTGERMLLWGDSFAAQYLPGLLRDQGRLNAQVLQYTFAGCPPILAYRSLARVGCATANAAVPDIVRREKISTVVIAARWTDVPPRTIDALHETVATLRRTGARVVVIGQSPQFGADVQKIDYISGQRANAAGGRWRVFFDRDINRRLAAQSRGATFVDPMAALCPQEACAYRLGRDYLYADYGHFSTAGAVRAVRAYFPASR